MVHPLIWPQPGKDNCSLSRTFRHLEVVTDSGAQQKKLSLQRHSIVPKLSFFNTEVEELNIVTRADTMVTALATSTKFVFHNK